jgi:hypothetical protein
MISKRRFIASSAGALAGLGLASLSGPAALARQAAAPAFGSRIPHRRARTTRLFKSPDGFPNALAGSADGLWIGEQKLSAALAKRYGIEEPKDLVEHAWLVDWESGELLRTVATESRNTSGMAYGDEHIWMVANAPPYGVFKTDMQSRTVSHRQIPLGGGGSHGAKYRNGKLWIVASRLRGLLCVDAETWQPEFMIPYDCNKRHHDIAFDDGGNLWLVTGNRVSNRYAEGEFGLAKYDSTTGELLETVELEPGSADPHGLEFHSGVLYSCDAGIHPGWPVNDSPHTGYIFRIDLV